MSSAGRVRTRGSDHVTSSGHVRTRGGGVARDGVESASPTHDARETRREDRVMAEETTFWPDFDEDGANEDQAIDDFLNVLLEIDTDTVKNQGGTPGGQGYLAARRSHARRSIHRELHRNVVLAGRDERARVRRRNLARPRRRWRDGSTHATSAGAAGERADGRTRAPNVRPDGRHRWRRRSSRHRRRRSITTEEEAITTEGTIISGWASLASSVRCRRPAVSTGRGRRRAAAADTRARTRARTVSRGFDGPPSCTSGSWMP